MRKYLILLFVLFSLVGNSQYVSDNGKLVRYNNQTVDTRYYVLDLIKDSTTETAIHCYGNRRLTTTYTANKCVLLHRASDNAELWFGFTSGYPDSYYNQDSVTTWITGTTATVVQWADQCGNKNLIQTTAANQPVFDNNNRLIDFTSVNTLYLQTAAFTFAITQPFTILLVCSKSYASTATRYLFDAISATQTALQSKSASWQLLASTTLVCGTFNQNRNIFTALFNGNSSSLYINGTISGSVGAAGANSMDGLTLGTAYNGTVGALVKAREIIIYPVALSAAGQAIYNKNTSRAW